MLFIKSKSHKLQHSQHARVRPDFQRHNKSTNFTWKNFNNQTRHQFIELRLRTRISSKVVMLPLGNGK